jgi:16S rRNA (guanine1207-N2)-methyltransferase
LGAVVPGGLILIDGAKEEGIEAVLKALKPHVEVDGVFSKAHGKLIWFRRPDGAGGRRRLDRPADGDGGRLRHRARRVLGRCAGSRVRDPRGAGAAAEGARCRPWGGWGYLAGEILAEQAEITHLDLIEADHDMLEAARVNIDDPRAAFHWADATRFDPEEPYDAIIANPPFHTGRRADPGLGRAFISAAARMLKPSGKFIMVANRHLPYEAALKDAFGTGRLIGELEGYKLYEAGKPRQGPGRPSRGHRR